ncbi:MULTISPECIES: hypothetical protein [Arthrobacter]|uniref:Uncharacterized protein n=2 Tax=Arthrobacter jinronghuae TaxID=2964609 RepID=A0ABT1NUC6_9MICC|nr:MULTISPECIES: hypothetical protein [Arthrobacter]MCQ1950697.1 hypothetical protein [Arthrobacter jinronghuae]MCQ1954020.1 hypothetical protein [Arthrobacter sp. zg-Y238]
MEPQVNSSQAAVLDTNRTSREIFDDFMATSDAAIQATGALEGWRFTDEAPWSPVHEQPILAETCGEGDNTTGPWHFEHVLLGEPAENPEADRDQMRRYLESQGMEITAQFQPEPHEPAHAPWTVSGKSPDGVKIKYSSNHLGRGFIVTSECSSHPSMQEVVSPTTP